MFEESHHAKTDPTGRLKVDIVTDFKNAEVEISVRIAEPLSRHEYLAFIERTFGAIEDSSFTRPEQDPVRPPVKFD